MRTMVFFFHFRLYPPIPLTIRSAVNDDHMNKFFIPKGTNILLAIGAMMR